MGCCVDYAIKVGLCCSVQKSNAPCILDTQYGLVSITVPEARVLRELYFVGFGVRRPQAVHNH